MLFFAIPVNEVDHDLGFILSLLIKVPQKLGNISPLIMVYAPMLSHFQVLEAVHLQLIFFSVRLLILPYKANNISKRRQAFQELPLKHPVESRETYQSP